ncbi:hypothetical protein Taro_051687, partial [Colocasia esculenta]|nr:hypothetical protein [Colocasia esculenta]
MQQIYTTEILESLTTESPPPPPSAASSFASWPSFAYTLQHHSQMSSLGLSCPVGAGGGDPEVEEEPLDSLLEALRTTEGRSHLTPHLSAVLRRIRPDLPFPLLIPTLHLLRNLCAGEPAGQAAFMAAVCTGVVTSVVLSGGGAGACPLRVDVARVGLQLLGNVAAAGEKGQRDVWDRFFPEGLLELARVRDAWACDVLCSCCCSAGEGRAGRLEELCSVGRGLPILKEVLATACSDDYRGDWLKLLLSRICIEELYLPLLFSMFSSCEFSDSQNDADYRDTHFTTEQAFLLGLLSEILSGLFYRGTISSDFALAIFQVLKEAASIMNFTSRGSSPLPTGSPAIDVLGYSLTILRDLCASDDSPSSGSDRLGANKESSSASPSSSKVCPHRGFRRDVVAVIGNCTCGMKQVQDEIRQQNGILLLLQQCVVDEDNPYLREWGMLTVSYLLEGNVENQQHVAELELQEPIDTPEITSLGLKVDIDKKTGRVRL